MGKRIVIALGGNALGKNLEEQMHAVKTTASAIADLIEDGVPKADVLRQLPCYLGKGIATSF